MLRTTAFAAAFGLIATALPAEARAVMIAPGRFMPESAVQGDVIVVGKVTEIEKEMVQAAQGPGQPKVGYTVASVKVTEAILGAKGKTAIRVGWVGPAKAADAPAGDVPAVAPGVIRPGIRPIRPMPVVALAEGQEALLVLKKHHEGDFYVLANQFSAVPLDKKAADFDKQLEQVKKVVQIVENPVEALKAKELADRFLAAKIVMTKLQAYPAVAPGDKVERVDADAETSKLVLKVLAELPWTDIAKPQEPSRSQLWYMLGLAPTDFKQPAFTPGTDFNVVMNEATAAWLKDNADKYRLKKNVVAKADKK